MSCNKLHHFQQTKKFCPEPVSGPLRASHLDFAVKQFFPVIRFRKINPDVFNRLFFWITTGQSSKQINGVTVNHSLKKDGFPLVNETGWLFTPKLTKMITSRWPMDKSWMHVARRQTFPLHLLMGTGVEWILQNGHCSNLDYTQASPSTSNNTNALQFQFRVFLLCSWLKIRGPIHIGRNHNKNLRIHRREYF